VASIGLQIGIQSTSHVLFFMTDQALEKFRNADGWEAGVDAEITFPDKGLNAGIDSTTFEKPVIAIVFAEDGLLVGASLAGAKYSSIAR
jgi:lipid-binding SYLF domain-containing protein